MAKKKAQLFGVQASGNSQTTLPTFKQFIQSEENDRSITKYHVDIIWEPGRFSNYTIQTTHFRLRIDESHPLYEGLHENYPQISAMDTGLYMHIRDYDEGTFVLDVSDRIGKWEHLGTTGIRFKSTDPNTAPW